MIKCIPLDMTLLETGVFQEGGYFAKVGKIESHHIHFYQFDNPQIERHLIFRNYLRCHHEEVVRYSHFKAELSHRFENTSEYSPAKKDFVSEMEQLALSWFAEIQQK